MNAPGINSTSSNPQTNHLTNSDSALFPDASMLCVALQQLEECEFFLISCANVNSCLFFSIF